MKEKLRSFKVFFFLQSSDKHVGSFSLLIEMSAELSLSVDFYIFPFIHHTK